MFASAPDEDIFMFSVKDVLGFGQKYGRKRMGVIHRSHLCRPLSRQGEVVDKTSTSKWK